MTHILARTDSLLAYFSSKTYPVPTRFTVEGTYEGLKEVDEVANDSIFSFAISLVLIFPGAARPHDGVHQRRQDEPGALPEGPEGPALRPGAAFPAALPFRAIVFYLTV